LEDGTIKLEKLKNLNLLWVFAGIIALTLALLIANASFKANERANDPNRSSPMAFEKRGSELNRINCVSNGKIYWHRDSWHMTPSCPAWSRLATTLFDKDKAVEDAVTDFKEGAVRPIAVFNPAKPLAPKLPVTGCTSKQVVAAFPSSACILNYQKVTACFKASNPVTDYAQAYNREIMRLKTGNACTAG